MRQPQQSYGQARVNHINAQEAQEAQGVVLGEFLFSSVLARVPRSVGNRTGLAGSRWNRSGPVHEPVRFPVPNRAYNFLSPPNRPFSPVYRSVFLVRGNQCGAVWGTLVLATILFDSEASYSFISSSFVEKHNIPTVLLKAPLLTRTPGGDIKCQLGYS
jgi:hypothetical protein